MNVLVSVPRLALSKQRPEPFLSPLQPIPELGQRVRALNQQRAAAGLPSILLHTDAAQALGKRRVDVADLAVDFLTIVGHKVRLRSPRHGPALTCHPGPAEGRAPALGLQKGAPASATPATRGHGAPRPLQGRRARPGQAVEASRPQVGRAAGGLGGRCAFSAAAGVHADPGSPLAAPTPRLAGVGSRNYRFP